MQGLIVENIANLYKVKICQKGSPLLAIYDAVARGKIKQEEISPVVGDIVDIEVIDENNKKAVIDKILPRKMYLKRPKLANLTQLIIVVSSNSPKPDLLLLDKQLSLANYLGLSVVIILNKIDLDKNEEFKEIEKIYTKIGYKVIKTQAKDWIRNRRSKEMFKR